jgi:hypothetical protein
LLFEILSNFFVLNLGAQVGKSLEHYTHNENSCKPTPITSSIAAGKLKEKEGVLVSP